MSARCYGTRLALSVLTILAIAIFRQRNLVKDGVSGRSLIKNPVALLTEAIKRVVNKGHEPNFANNSALIHAAVFGFVKEQTQRGWSEHTSEGKEPGRIRSSKKNLIII